MLVVKKEISESPHYVSLYLLPEENVPPEMVLGVASLIRVVLLMLTHNLRLEYRVEIFWNGKIDKRRERAVQRGGTHTLVLTGDGKTGILRNLSSRTETPTTYEEWKDEDKLMTILEKNKP